MDIPKGAKIGKGGNLVPFLGTVNHVIGHFFPSGVTVLKSRGDRKFRVNVTNDELCDTLVAYREDAWFSGMILTAFALLSAAKGTPDSVTCEKLVRDIIQRFFPNAILGGRRNVLADSTMAEAGRPEASEADDSDRDQYRWHGLPSGLPAEVHA